MNRRRFFQTSTTVSAASLLPAVAQTRIAAVARDRAKKILFWDLAKLDYWDNIELVQGEPEWQPEASYVDPFDGGKRGGNFPIVWHDAESERWRMIYSVKWSPYTMSADARYGEIRFQLTDEKSQPIAGFSFEDCLPFRRANAFDQQLLWKNANLGEVLGKVIRLEVELRNAELFSFTAAHHFLDAQDKWLLTDGKEIDTRLFDF